MNKNDLEQKISGFYEEFLLRKPDKTGLYYFVSMIENGESTIDEGFHTAYQIRANPETKETPIIMLTAVVQQTGFKFSKDDDEAFLPVDEFIEKPVNPKKLIDTVRKLLVPVK